MVANPKDYVRASDGTGTAVRAVVASKREPNDLYLNVDSVAHWPNKFIATAGTLDEDTGMLDPDTFTEFYGHLEGSIIVIEEFCPGYSDYGNEPYDIVVIKPATAWADAVSSATEFLDGFEQEIDDIKQEVDVISDVVENSIKTTYAQDMDLSHLPDSTFYPVYWNSLEFVELEVISPSNVAAHPWNTNRFRATISARGWHDIRKRLNVYEFSQFDSDETTIHSIASGKQNGTNAVYIRGGLAYKIRCNVPLTLATSTITISDETFPLLNTGGSPITPFVNVTANWWTKDDGAILDVDKLKNSMPGKLLAASTLNNFDNTYPNKTYISGSNISVTLPPGGTSIIVHVYLSMNINADSQCIVELWNGLGGSGSRLTRRVPATGSRAWSDANMTHVLTGLTPGETYNFSLTVRDSVNNTTIRSDPTATNQIYAVLG